MRLTVIEGGFVIAMFALTDAFYVPYLNAMGASPVQIGLGVCLPSLATGLVQFLGPLALYQVGSRRKLVIFTAVVQSLSYIPAATIWYFARERGIWPIIAAFVIASVAGNISMAGWADWMSHVVRKRLRGQYFARRNRILGLVQAAISVGGGFFLDLAIGKVMLAFSAIWVVCGISRTIGWILTSQMYEPPVPIRHSNDQESFGHLLAGTLTTNFGRYTASASLFIMGSFCIAPFVAVHVLNNLHFNYTQYTFIRATDILTNISFLWLWGRIIDRVGAAIPMKLCALIIAAAALPWVLCENYWYLLGGMVLNGFAWSGFGLATFVFYLNNTTPQNRVSCIAYYTAFWYLGICAGSALAGWLTAQVPIINHFPLQTVFLIGFSVQLLAALAFQMVKDKPYHGKLSPLERVFFDPQLVSRLGLGRSLFRFIRRGN